MTSEAWLVLRAKHLYRVVDERAGALRPPLLAVSIHHGVVLRSSLTHDQHRADDLSAYKRCEKGDIVLNRMRAFQGAIGIAPSVGLVSPDYIVLRPRAVADARYLHHLFRSLWFVSEMASRLRGIGSVEQGNVRTPRINAEDLGEIPVRLPQRYEQGAIADFLDRETARIDALVAAKRRMIELLAERLLSTMADALDSVAKFRCVKLGQALERIIDYRGATPEKTSSGVVLLTASNVIDGRIMLEPSRQYVSPEVYSEWMRRGFPRAGDVLLTTEAPLGEVALISDTSVALAQRLMILRPRPDLMRPDFLHVYLRSPQGRRELLSRASGSTVMGVRTDRLRDLPVIAPSLQEQEAVVTRVGRETEFVTTMTSVLLRQIDLLVEHRQALTTAAVTGEIDVLGVAA